MESPVQFLGHSTTIIIDRPMGSRHPKWGFIYPVNYGYLPRHPAPDGEDIDAYLLGVFEPVEQFQGICIAVFHRLNDDDDKLVITPDRITYNNSQIIALTEFQERFWVSEIIR